MEKSDALSRKVIISNTLGIHARPAAKIAKMAQLASQTVWLASKSNNAKADAASVVDILSLCGRKGDTVQISISTPRDKKVLDAIYNFFESGFGED